MQRLTWPTVCDNQWLLNGVPFEGTIESRLDTDLLSFSTATGDILHIQVDEVTGSGFVCYWRVLHADGTQYRSWSTSATADIGPMPPSPNPWRLQIGDSDYQNPGTYRVRIDGISPSGVDTTSVIRPARLVLTASPNPANAAVGIRFGLPKAGHVRLDVYDPSGRIVGTLADEPLAAGFHEIVWTPTRWANGIYYCRLAGCEETRTRKILLLR